jgi:hypothetical protein
MRRRFLALSVPLIATALAAPSVAAAAGGSSVLAGKSPTVTDTGSKTMKSGGSTGPSGRRWN